MTTFNNENFRAVVMLDANVQSSKKAGGAPITGTPTQSVGVTGIEPATSRPPDAHSNRTELHPELLILLIFAQ